MKILSTENHNFSNNKISNMSKNKVLQWKLNKNHANNAQKDKKN